MKRNSALALLLLSIACAPATAPKSARPPSTGSAAGDAPLISEASVRAHMEFLASDAMNGRASGTRDEWIAATYLASQLRRWGIEPPGDGRGYVQTIEIERPELSGPPVLTIGDRRFTHGKEAAVVSMPAPRVAGPLAKHQAGAAPPAGAVVVVGGSLNPLPPELMSAAVILAKPDACGPMANARGRQPRVAARTVGVTPPPARPVCVMLDAEAFAAAEKTADGTPVVLEGTVGNVQKRNTWNTVGKITGSDATLSSQVILLSAHMDHVPPRPNAPAGADNIFNGADDDASGSIAVLEIAAAMAQGPKPKRTVVFAWFGSEEEGGTGSRYFADTAVVPLASIVANLQFEMIGRPDPAVPPHTLWLTGYERSTLGPELAKRGAKLVQDPHPKENFFTRSDNIQFARRGVVAHTVSSFGLHKEYHSPEDEIEKIDFAHMTDAIRSMVAPIAWLAGSDWKPTWNPGGQPK